MVSVTVVDRANPPPVPVIVKVYDPVATVVDVLMLRVDWYVGLPELGLNDDAAPVGGRPVKPSETDCGLPLVRLTVTVKDVDCP